MSDMDFPVVPGNEPVTEVTVHRHMIYESGLTDPLDSLSLLHLMFMVAAGENPTAATLLAALRAQGVRSGNGSGLIGRDAVQASFRRLVAAGFLRRRPQENGARGRFGGAGYELYRRPLFNPDWRPAEPSSRTDSSPETPQVGPDTAMPGTGMPESKKTAGRTVDGIPGHGATVPGNAGRGRKRIPAGRTVDGNAGHGGPFPPHPQGEVETSSPYPLTNHAGEEAAAPQEEGGKFTPKETIAAVDFLQRLDSPWTVGRSDAQKLAPLLLSVMFEQGWPQITELTQQYRDLLVELLTREAPVKMYSPAQLLRRNRIPNLPLHDVAARSLSTRSADRPALPTWCGICNYGEEPDTPAQRRRELPSGPVIPCPECHPSAVLPTVVPTPAPDVAASSSSQGPRSVEQLLDGLRKPTV